MICSTQTCADLRDSNRNNTAVPNQDAQSGFFISTSAGELFQNVIGAMITLDEYLPLDAISRLMQEKEEDSRELVRSLASIIEPSRHGNHKTYSWHASFQDFFYRPSKGQ